MLLSRLRIRGKLTLLVMIPLLAMAGLVVPVVRGLVADAGQATEIDNAATVAGRIGGLLQDLERERLLSVGFVLGVVDEDDLTLQTALVTDRVLDVREDLGDEVPPALGAVTEAPMVAMRSRVRLKRIPPQEILDRFGPVLDGLIESLELVRHADADTAAGRQLIALDALLRMDEASTESTAQLAIMAGGNVGRQDVKYHEERAEYDTNLARFAAFATEPQQRLYDLVTAAFDQRVGDNFEDDFEADPNGTMAGLPIGTLFPALQSFNSLGSFVEKRLVDDVTALVSDQRQRQLTTAYGIGALALFVLLAVLILVAAVARAVAVPLIRLSRSAAQVAEAGETELRRVADDERETVEPVHLEVLQVSSNDEIGDLARVFERVQSTSSQLVERQVLSRRNVAEMFGHIGRRTQNLVGGQVSLIDELENEEANPDRLAKLYRLDHIANRLRRSADSLVVISGSEREESHRSPVRLVDVVRLALAEIEEYTRVDVDVPLDLSVAPALVSDLVLICAELLENATSYSPPHTRVSVSARAVPDGVRLVVVDHGIGMPDERLTEENARIARRERLDLVPSQVLGLFVVGRLSRRHGLEVALAHTPGGGVTVGVNIGDALLAGDPVAPAMPVSPAVPVRQIVPAPAVVPLTEWSPSPWDDAGPAGTVPRSPGGLQPTETEALSRVSDLMRREQFSWNAFEVVRSLPAAPPRQEAPPPPPARPEPPAPQPVADADGRSLSRRVPGATLSPHDPPPARAAGLSSVEQDPDAARSLIEQIESGVARALHDASHRNHQ
ncbi:nitrate- and nitrite sensing domain-containing protein [Actinoplanes sp. NPDC051470]|uniref:sensor histidine kinase n=1 Tax=Actinoplanes sp. NPDC051470 TaxID=3157224 RepID=UPI0034265600